MNRIISKFFFNKRDHQLIKIVNDVVSSDKASYRYTKRIYYPYFHPHGIKELAESKGLRIAYAVVNLLHSLEKGEVDDRLNSLKTLHDEILYIGEGAYPRNTARALLEIMKELVRTHGDYNRQLKLARDFRETAYGKPRTVRKELRKYHLLEMPEAWNQITFDDHVHDVNTKGRKSSTHLIMDAWIKGIRKLRVIYFNFIQPSFVEELLEAAEIMGIDVRIGIEFSARFRNRYIQFIWVPHGFADSQSFLCFLEESSVRAFMEKGRKVSEYQQQYVMDVLDAFNDKHIYEINEKFQIQLSPLSKAEFIEFVGPGQKSLLHLAKFIFKKMLPPMKDRVEVLREIYKKADKDEKQKISDLVTIMDLVNTKYIIDHFLCSEKNLCITNPGIPEMSEGTPELLKYSPSEIIKILSDFHSAFHITLNLKNLDVADIIEILYDCEGSITRIEVFNLKDYNESGTVHIPEIIEFKIAVNEGNSIKIKRFILDIIDKVNDSGFEDKDDRIKKLVEILHDINSLKLMYKATPLKPNIGSDSTGRSRHLFGMGFAIIETLPYRAQKEFNKRFSSSRGFLPINVIVYRRKTFVPKEYKNFLVMKIYKVLKYLPLISNLVSNQEEDWVVHDENIRINASGNIITLGGINKILSNGLSLNPEKKKKSTVSFSWEYLNSHLKNTLKVIIGFIPAFLTFYLTKDWWLLAYFGAFIWFGITGMRNIIQSVLGGGGINRSQFLKWNDYVRWERITDSLLFTGFSVPLLDYLVKTVILNNYAGITTASEPVLLYTFMALANGIYLSSHNAFRGLPRGAVIGNLFRSILSIPIAIAFNAAIGGVLGYYGIININSILQKWAAVISKLASDCVAGIIEGTADRHRYIRVREQDYNSKLSQLFDIYAKLELLFPDLKVFELLDLYEKEFRKTKKTEAMDYAKIIMINSLDMLYFWMYQPRSRTVFKRLLNRLTQEEKEIFKNSKFLLNRNKEISMLFVEGTMGKKFSKPLAFYLNNFEDYLKTINRMF